MADYEYDLFVIGGGSGGVRAARLAGEAGYRVALAEEYRVGGTCVIRGCVPKKLFVYASAYGEALKSASAYGWSGPGLDFDWPTLVANKDREIARLNGVYIANLERAGVTLFHERAEMESPHTLRLVASGRKIRADKLLIATGARPFLPQIPGIEHAITSNEAFHLEHLPQRIMIVGGGYIAVEFAGIFNGLGVETTLVYRGEEILRGFDDDLRTGLHKAMTGRGINVHLHTNPDRIVRQDNGRLQVHCGDDFSQSVDTVMFATGRVPYTQALGLENTNVQLDGRGAIVVNDFSQTAVENIYAVGDVTARMNLTPVAIREGAAFVDTAFKDRPRKVDYADVPTAVFSQPEIGTVGLTEGEAKKVTDCLHIYRTHFRPMKFILPDKDEQMLLKLIVDGHTDRVLGCHIIGPEAGEVIQVLGIAVKMRATKADFDATMAVHPTAMEEFVTLKKPSQIWHRQGGDGH